MLTALARGRSGGTAGSECVKASRSLHLTSVTLDCAAILLRDTLLALRHLYQLGTKLGQHLVAINALGLG